MAFLHCIQQRGTGTFTKGVSDRKQSSCGQLSTDLCREVLPILAPMQYGLGIAVLIPIFNYA